MAAKVMLISLGRTLRSTGLREETVAGFQRGESRGVATYGEWEVRTQDAE